MATKPDPHTVALLPAPDGYGPVDFDNPQRRGVPACYWITGVGFILATSFLTMRIFTKLRIVRDFKSEDCTKPSETMIGILTIDVRVCGWGLRFQYCRTRTSHQYVSKVTQYPNDHN